MLPSSRRLRASEVRAIIATGKVLRGDYLSIKYLKRSGPARSATVVSKKLAKTSVLRNKVRRWVYSALRHELLPSGVEAVVFVQKIPATKPFSFIVADLTHLCSKQFS